MEVMSSLLFLVLALLPQVLGRQQSQPDSNQDVKKYSQMLLVDETNQRHPLLLNTNGKFNSMDSIFNDYSCKKCFKCMVKAIAAVRNSPSPKTPTIDRHSKNVIATHRIKRSARASDAKGKLKKSKTKLITVTKYNFNGLLHAIKVKETNNESTSCEVYAVTKSYSCNSPEAQHMLSVATISKKNRPDKGKKQSPNYQVDPNTTTAPPTEPTVIKRAVDNSQVPVHDTANVALSFEEYF